MIYYRKDSPKGITPPNPDGTRDMVAHITKHRGMKTPYTSVSEDRNAVRHFSGELYKTDSSDIIRDNHIVITHYDLTEKLKGIIQASRKEEKVIASRAFMLACRAKESLIDWQFRLDSIDRKERINWCFLHIQKYFQRV